MKKQIFLTSSLMTLLLSSQQSQCNIFANNLWDLHDIDKQFEQIEQNMSRMRHIFSDMEQQVQRDAYLQGLDANNLQANNLQVNSYKSSIKMEQKDGSIIISMDLGKNIKSFDGQIQTKKDGFKNDQIIVKTEDNASQILTIKADDNYLSVTQSTQTKVEKTETVDSKDVIDKSVKKESKEATKKESKLENKKRAADKQEDSMPSYAKASEDMPEIKNYAMGISQSMCTTGRTIDTKLDISKTSIEYDEKTGILTIVIPQELKQEKLGKNIDVKIKKEDKK